MGAAASNLFLSVVCVYLCVLFKEQDVLQEIGNNYLRTHNRQLQLQLQLQWTALLDDSSVSWERLHGMWWTYRWRKESCILQYPPHGTEINKLKLQGKWIRLALALLTIPVRSQPIHVTHTVIFIWQHCFPRLNYDLQPIYLHAIQIHYTSGACENNTLQNIYFLQHFSGMVGKTVHSGGILEHREPQREWLCCEREKG